MSLRDVLQRGDEFLQQYPRTAPWWNLASRADCLLAVGFSKFMLNSFYNPSIIGLEKLDSALQRSKDENRGLMTIMNHMSVVDDPFFWGMLPWSYYKDVDQIRWGLGAQNVCFKNGFMSYFFSLGKILGTERFGRGPFQGSIDAAIRILSPDDTLDLIYDGSNEVSNAWINYKNEIRKVTPIAEKIQNEYIPPIIRSKPSWFHVFPEGFVLQLEPPFNNSMRYFKWGITRLLLESTRQPIVLPIFAHGFEKIAPESAADSLIERFLPSNFGAEIKVIIGDPIDDNIITQYRKEWLALVNKNLDSSNPNDLSEELQNGSKIRDLRSRLASELRKSIAEVRAQAGFPEEDARFKEHGFWKRYTTSEGESDPDIKFIGQNWAIRRLQKFLNEGELQGADDDDDKK
jgi:monolysocardiolipin acyltransferase